MEQEIEDYSKYLKEVKNASENTISSYKRDLVKFIKYLEQQNINSIDKISETSLNSYILFLEKGGLKASTVSRNIASIKSFLLFFIKRGKLKKDPTERIRTPKVQRNTPDILSMDQINTLLDTPDTSKSKGIRDKAMLELLYATGVRVSELVSLKYADLNLKNSYILCNSGGKERFIPFGGKANDALTEYIKDRFQIDNVNNINNEELKKEYLFINVSGGSMSRQGFWKILKRYAILAGIDELTPNMLRHSFATHLLENGADIYTVQELLGLTDLSSAQAYFRIPKQKVRDVYINSHPRA